MENHGLRIFQVSVEMKRTEVGVGFAAKICTRVR